MLILYALVTIVMFIANFLSFFFSFKKLIPSYRGFIIDTLSELNYFDDQSISKDERFRYFNMKSQTGGSQ
jgi:glucan phosphoethanolaminetransferase (alkaline phosphatase superfamily)